MKNVQKILLFASIVFFSASHAQIISTIAGNGVAGCNGNGGPATASELISQYGIALAPKGIYFSDGDTVVRKISSSGIIYAFAGCGVYGYSGDGGPATSAELSAPFGIALDISGNIYIADVGNNVIRKVNASGIISTFAGNGHIGYSGDGGPATAAEFDNPYAVATDNFGNIYIADADNYSIRKVNTSGTISTFAGCGVQGYYGDGGPATAAEFSKIWGVSVDDSGNVLIPDRNNDVVRMVNTSGTVNTIAGIHYYGYSGDGGPATSAEIGFPIEAIRDKYGNIYITESAEFRVRQINTSGIINTFAGNGISGYYGDGGSAKSAELANPFSLAVDTFGNLYIPDGPRIREVYVSLNVASMGIANVSCNSANNGNASIVANEGLMPYTYSWSNGATTSSVTDLSAGTYTVNVVDSENIKGVVVVTITQPTALDILGDSINATGNNCNGSAWVAVTGGTATYNYLWTGSLTTDTITNQCAGTYCCLITDAHGCKDSTCVIINMTTGVQPIVSEPPINVYPNPGNGSFTLHYSSNLADNKSEFEVYNIYGVCIFSSSLSPSVKEHEMQINLNTQPSGLYLYRLKSESGRTINEGKLVITR